MVIKTRQVSKNKILLPIFSFFCCDCSDHILFHLINLAREKKTRLENDIDCNRIVLVFISNDWKRIK